MILRPSVLALVGLAAAAAAAVLGLSFDGDEPGDQPPPAIFGGLAGPPAADGRRLPAIEVLRVAAAGDAMIAGRALPGAAVRLRDAGSGVEIGHATADLRGQWVLVPELPLGSGARLLAPRQTGPVGTSDGDPVAVVVPGPGRGAALAVVLPAHGGARVLQPVPAAGTVPEFAIAVAGRDSDGHLSVAGWAEPGTTIHLHLDTRLVGRGRADGAGRWRIVARAPGEGRHRLRADAADAGGRVTGRIQCGWGDDDGPAPAPGELAVRTAGGIWSLVRRTRGGGTVLAEIYGDAPAPPWPQAQSVPAGQVVNAP